MSDLLYILQPLLVIALLASWVWAIQDALRAHRPWVWVLLVVFIPVVTVPFYLLNFKLFGGSTEGHVDKRLKHSARLKNLIEESRERDVPAVHLEIAELFFDQQKFREALASLSRVLEQDPEGLRAHYLAGASLIGIGQPEKALDHLEFLLQEDPKAYFGKGRLFYAVALEALERTDEAAREYQATLDRFTLPEAAVRLGRLMARQGRPAEAVVLLRETLKQVSDIPSDRIGEQRPWIKQAASDLQRLEAAIKAASES